MRMAAVYFGHDFRAHIHRIHDLGTAPFHSDFLKQFADTVEQHDADRLFKVSDTDCGDGRKAHQEVFIEDLSAGQILSCGKDDSSAEKQIANQQDYVCRDHKGYRVQDDTADKKRCSDQNLYQILFVFCAQAGSLFPVVMRMAVVMTTATGAVMIFLLVVMLMTAAAGTFVVVFMGMLMFM